MLAEMIALVEARNNWHAAYYAERKRAQELEEALRDLHSEVEMAESVGICLPDRVPSLRAGKVLSQSHATTEGVAS